ncbi:MAG: FAD-dependent oxidoreductase, partial [Pseudomonadota bacterium]|nr:FAD-dependent oxidoreductase [Pseudomonadota bacterium]
MLGVYPQLGDPQMHYAWSGLMGYALHKMPVIGELAPRQWAAAAFGGHGLNTTAMAGRLLARAIAEGDEEWRRFQMLGAPWIGGPLGRAGVQLSYWKMQLKDRYEEIRSRA